jgi:hypothetical protein
MKSFYKDHAVLQLLQLRTESSITPVARLVSGVRRDSSSDLVLLSFRTSCLRLACGVSGSII